MGVYNRNEDFPDREPNWWIDYYADGVRVREPGCGANRRASERLLEVRAKEIRLGTWRHPRLRSAEAMTVAQWSERHFAIRHVAAELSPSKRAKGNVDDQRKRVEKYVLPKLGDIPVVAVTTAHIKDVIADLVRSAAISPRSIHHVYNDTRGMFVAATLGESPLLARNPCTLTVKGYQGGLPKKRDKVPGWRAAATFSHGELFQLFTDERIPIDRRTLYALTFFCGNRFGEAAGRRVRDYDANAQPLGRIVCATQYDDQALKGDAPARDIPVHPFLAWMLKRWIDEGFELVMGREPRADDWLVPSRRGELRALSHTRNRLAQDLERVGLRVRSPHSLRAAFISLAQEDGGMRNVLEVVTHKGNNDVWGGYTRHPWHVLCEHVGRLRMEPPPDGPSPRSHSRSHAKIVSSKSAKRLEKVGRGDWIRTRDSHAEHRGKPGILENEMVEAYLEIRGDLQDQERTVTSRVTTEMADDLRLAGDIARSGRVDHLTADQRARAAAAADAAADHIDKLARALVSVAEEAS